MNCPKCGGKTVVITNYFNAEENELYRRRLCKNLSCSHRFYSVEFEVDENQKIFKKNLEK